MFITDLKINFKVSYYLFFLKILVSLNLLVGCQSFSEYSSPDSIPLATDLGKHHYPISTSSPKAQRYFDQGLILSFGFNHAEAARSFRTAYRIDPDCALCYWGEALVLGPNINAPMEPSVVLKAYQLSQKALAKSPLVTDKEKALIRALSQRYVQKPTDDRHLLDLIYADSMRKVAERFPEDALIASLLAEALMDIHPWDFWNKQGVAQPWTDEIVSILERALSLDSNNPLANHLYIHILEASPFAEKALDSARRLPSLVPGSGHLVHMPAHIYIRLGLYRDTIIANQQAVKVDQNYLSHHHEESIYTMAYVPHNYHFLWAAAIKTGQKALSTQAANDTANQVNQTMLRTSGFSGTLQHFKALPLYTKILFGEWNKVLNIPAPAEDLIYIKGVWHYARGLALLRKGMVNETKAELANLEKIITEPTLADLTVFDLNPVSQLLKISVEILKGELAMQNNEINLAITHIQNAINIEDSLNYTEPKDWYLPPRQVLGTILLKAKKFIEAEQVYRQDLRYHPQNGWSLFGLQQSLRAQYKNIEADVVLKQFELVWQDADVTITGSCY